MAVLTPTPPVDALSTTQTIELFARLRWRLLRGALRHGGAQRVAVVIGMIASVIAGLVSGLTLAVYGQRADFPGPILVIAPVAMIVAIVALSIITGVTQPIDPRIVATEPLTDRQLAIGMLTASAFGPPGLAASLVGVGLYLGSLRGLSTVISAALAAISFLLTLLLVSRTVVNALGLFTSRFPRTGQVIIALASLAFYGAFQLVIPILDSLGPSGRDRVADIVRYSPPGQLGTAFATAGDSFTTSFTHMVIGSLWLPILAAVFMWTTRRLLVTSPDSARGGAARGELTLLQRLVKRLCGPGAVGAIAWRSVRTRMRHPRTALETLIGAGIGMSLVLVPALTRDEVGAAAVLVGGAVQLAVIFMAGNSIGSDGPALGSEILCGLEPETIVTGKARSVIIVAGPLAILGPIAGAAVSGEWSFLLAGVLVGVGGLLAGTGGALVQSTMVPVAVPESDNPLASGDTGSGLLSALVLAVVVIALGLVTLPIALALLWALDRGSVVLVSILGAATVGVGWLVLRLAIQFAANRWRTREPEIYDAIIPAR